MRKSIFATVFAVSMSFASANAMADQIKAGWSGIVEELFQTIIVVEGLEAIGYDVGDLLQTQIALMYVSLGQGDVDFYAAGWIPLHNAFIKESGGEPSLQPVGNLATNSLQGYLIDKKTADATGIKFLEDLKDPELAKLFDIDGNGKADLYGCESGWGCERVIEHHLTVYGLRDTVEHKQGGYFTIIADAIERIREGKPTLYYTWTPLWLSGVLRPGHESIWLNVKETSLPDGRKGNTTAEGLGNLGFEVNDQKIVANTKFLNANPKAKKLFELLQISIGDINAQNKLVNDGEKSDAQIRGHAMAWIAKNQVNWDKWIAAAKAAE